MKYNNSLPRRCCGPLQTGAASGPVQTSTLVIFYSGLCIFVGACCSLMICVHKPRPSHQGVVTTTLNVVRVTPRPFHSFVSVCVCSVFPFAGSRARWRRVLCSYLPRGALNTVLVGFICVSGSECPVEAGERRGTTQLGTAPKRSVQEDLWESPVSCGSR